MAAPDWVRHAIWWQVYPLGATGAEPEALPPGAEAGAAAARAAELARPPDHVGRDFPRGLHQQLIGLRRRSPWLVDATLEAPDVLTNEVLAVRLTSGTRTLALVLDVGDAAAEVVLPFPGGTVDAGSGSAHTDGSRTTVRVPPHSFAVVGRSG